MSEQPIDLNPSGPPDTILPAEPEEASQALEAALTAPSDDRRGALGAVAAQWPRYVDAWARLGELSEDAVESYAYFRIGYHRGLDALRASGWRGSGYVRWEHDTNRGFLRALIGLRAAALRIGEQDEVARIGEFLNQLDPALDF
ncbi:DUF3151 family protein [Actinomycetota bacterium]